MLIDRDAILATIAKVENKKLKLADPALMWGGVMALKNALSEDDSGDLDALAKVTAKDGNGAADYALVSLVSLAGLPAGTEQRRKAGVLSGRQVILGDLVVDGALTITGATLVTGNLKANAVNVAETGVLVVGGSLEARLASGDGWFWVRGSANVELALGYYEAGEFRVGNRLTATLGIMSNHGCVIADNATRHWFELEDADADDEDYLRLEALVDEKALAPEDGEADHGLHRVDFRALSRLAALGQPLLRTATKGKGKAPAPKAPTAKRPPAAPAKTIKPPTKPAKPTPKPAKKAAAPSAKPAAAKPKKGKAPKSKPVKPAAKTKKKR